MRALVTGASGFIGSHLARGLRQRGYDVCGLVRPTSDRRNLTGVDLALVHGDVREPATLDAALDGRDIVFHAASPYTFWGISEVDLFETTVAGARNVLQAAARQGVRRVVLTSSSVVAGSRRTARVIADYEALGVADEPAYVRAKAEQERLAFELGQRLGIEVVAVRPTVTVGARWWASARARWRWRAVSGKGIS